MFYDVLDKFLVYLEAKGNSPRTIATYAQRLRLFQEAIGSTGLDEISPEMVDRWVVEMRRAGLAPDTVRSRVRDVRSFFRWCVGRGYLAKSPADHLALRGRAVLVVKAMDRDDLRAMIDAAENERDRALVLFMASTGCRSGEVAGLRLADVDLGRREAWVSGKTGPRLVDFNLSAATALRAWLQTHPTPDGDLVFVGLRHPHNPITADLIYQLFRRLAMRAGVTGRFNPHSVRHLVGQVWTDQANLELTRQKLGHRDISTTAVYANQDRSRLKEATDRIEIL